MQVVIKNAYYAYSLKKRLFYFRKSGWFRYYFKILSVTVVKSVSILHVQTLKSFILTG